MEYITSRPFATRQPTAAMAGAGFPGGCGDVPPLPMPLFIQMKPLTAFAWACREAFKRALKGGYNEKKTQSDLALWVTWLLLKCVCATWVPADSCRIRYWGLNRTEGICLILILDKGRELPVVCLKHALWTLVSCLWRSKSELPASASWTHPHDIQG